MPSPDVIVLLGIGGCLAMMCTIRVSAVGLPLFIFGVLLVTLMFMAVLVDVLAHRARAADLILKPVPLAAEITWHADIYPVDINKSPMLNSLVDDYDEGPRSFDTLAQCRAYGQQRAPALSHGITELLVADVYLRWSCKRMSD